MSEISSIIRSLNPADLLNWLRETLSGNLDIPRITPDEPPAVSLVRVSADFSGIVLTKFEKACVMLSREFALNPRWSESGYERQMLSLLSSLRLTEASLPLESLAKAFPSHLRIEARQQVLHAIHDIGRRHDAAFWMMLAKQRPADFGGIAFSALLRFRHQAEALNLLTMLPDQQETAASAFTLLQLAFRKIAPEDQTIFLEETSKRLTQCKPTIRRTMTQWLETRGYVQPRKHSKIAPALIKRFYYKPVPAKLCNRVPISEPEPAFA